MKPDYIKFLKKRKSEKTKSVEGKNVPMLNGHAADIRYYGRSLY